MKIELSKIRYNTDEFYINGKHLFEFNGYLTDTNFLVDENCVILKDCSIESLGNMNSKTDVLALLTDEYIQSVINNNEIITKRTNYSYKGQIIYFTEKREIIINENYADIFESADNSFYDEKSDCIYHFIDISPGKDIKELMFIGLVKRILGTKQLYENIKATDEFIKNLPPLRKEERY